jgi:alginate O-acetyltransferase complex protein AlgI
MRGGAMLFNSIAFLVFFPIVATLYFICVRVVRTTWLPQMILLAASLFFYMCWNPAYIVLILLSISITWASGLLMEGAPVRKKCWVLTGSLVSNLGILFFFKYYGFFAEFVASLSSSLPIDLQLPVFKVLLPVGISFYTFQALGYSIDVYRGDVPAERNFLTYGLFVTFFPQLVAGPIERTAHLLPQFKVNYAFEYNRVTDGLKLAAWGMFKKVVVADQLAIYVNSVYSDIPGYSGTAIALATIFFAFQILCDFSGYTDIAIGIAQVLGFNIMTNFRRPYFATSIRDFWKRWHISLSTWFRDYLYISMGGNRVSVPRHFTNLFITFVISGLWHGAAWHFVAWGALHGFYHIFGTLTKGARDIAWRTAGFKETSAFRRAVSILTTFGLVCIAWILFRADTLPIAIHAIIRALMAPKELMWACWHFMANGSAAELSSLEINLSMGFKGVLWRILLVGSVICADFLQGREPGINRVRAWPFAIRWMGYYLLIIITILTGLSRISATSEFIYFQF